MTLVAVEDGHFAVSPDGHYGGSPGIESQIVYIGLTDDDRYETLSPTEFAAKYKWNNNPSRVAATPGPRSAAPAATSTKWRETRQQADAAYDANRFDEAMKLYDTALAAMAQDRQTDSTVLGTITDLARKRRSLTQFVIDRSTLPTEKQIEVTQAKLAELNPQYTGKGSFSIKDGRITRAGLRSCGLRDLGPLKGLPLVSLDCSHNKIVDLTPLKSIPLAGLDCSENRIVDLTPLKGIPLERFQCRANYLVDLSPLRGMPLENLDCARTTITDLAPLRGAPLIELQCYGNKLTDLAPLSEMPLKIIDCGTNRIPDLSPLKGMPLQSFRCGLNPVADLSPLKGMRITRLAFSRSKVTDLSSLKGMMLILLAFDQTQVSDLSPLKGMPLTELSFRGAPVRDLLPLADMQLVHFSFDPENITAGLDIVRNMKSITKLRSTRILGPDEGSVSPAEFWKAFDAQQKADGE